MNKIRSMENKYTFKVNAILFPISCLYLAAIAQDERLNKCIEFEQKLNPLPLTNNRKTVIITSATHYIKRTDVFLLLSV